MTEMLQKSKNVAKNVANENLQDLTEQWKKRTLRNGAYYIKMLGGDILPAFCNTDYILKQFQTMKGIYDDVAEVLAPVPSYDELQNMNEAVNQAIAANIKLVDDNKRLKHDVGNLGYKIKNQRHDIENRLKEIEKLKELLKECKTPLEVYNEMFGNKEELLTKIDEVVR